MLIRALALAVAASVAACAPLGAVNELAPTGKLRFGIVSAPKGSTFFVVKDQNGEPHGVTVDLALELGKRLGVEVEFTIAPNSGLITDALAAAKIDAAFMPVDDERRKRVDFGPAYAMGRNTFLVSAASGIRTMAEVDRPNVRVVAISGTTTIRTSQRVLKTAKVFAATSVDEALEALRSGKAEAFALSHDTLAALAPRVPGSRILDGDFNKLFVAIAVPKNRPAALAYVTEFMEDAKRSGIVRRAFDDSGFKSAEVAP